MNKLCADDYLHQVMESIDNSIQEIKHSDNFTEQEKTEKINEIEQLKIQTQKKHQTYMLEQQTYAIEQERKELADAKRQRELDSLKHVKSNATGDAIYTTHVFSETVAVLFVIAIFFNLFVFQYLANNGAF